MRKYGKINYKNFEAGMSSCSLSIMPPVFRIKISCQHENLVKNDWTRPIPDWYHPAISYWAFCPIRLSIYNAAWIHPLHSRHPALGQ